MSEQRPADYDALYALSQRLWFSPHEPDAPEPQLFVGQLPNDLPVSPPVPEGFRLVGGVTGKRATILLETDREPDDAMEVFTAAILAAGWLDDTHPAFRQHGGFVYGGTNQTFHRGEDGPSMWTQSFARLDGKTEMRLTLQPAEMARQQRMMRRGMMEGLIPPLRPPTGKTQEMLGGGGGGGSWSSYASLKSDASPATIAAHYVAQLERAGWTRTDAGDDQFSAWTTWTFDAAGGTYRGLFTVVAPTGETAERLLSVRTTVT